MNSPLAPYPASQPELVECTRQAARILATSTEAPLHPWPVACDIAERVCAVGGFDRLAIVPEKRSGSDLAVYDRETSVRNRFGGRFHER